MLSPRPPAGSHEQSPPQPRVAPGKPIRYVGPQTFWQRRTGRRILLCLALLLVVAGLWGIVRTIPQLREDGLDRQPFRLYLASSLVVVIGILTGLRAARIHWAPHSGSPRTLTPQVVKGGIVPVVAAGVALSFAGIAGYRAYSRTIVESTTDITILWLSGVGILLVMVLAGRKTIESVRRSLRSAIGPRQWQILLAVTGIMVLTISIRFWNRMRFPSASYHDEWFFIVSARYFRDGIAKNPYRTLDVIVQSDVWSWVDGLIARPLPDEPSSYRLLVAILGTITVVVTILLGRRTLGTPTALLGGLIVSTLPAILWASRTAVSNILDPLVLITALWLTDRVLETRDRRDALACGIILGVGYYGYFGARAFPAVIAVCMLAILRGRPFSRSLLDFIRLGLWMTTGFVVTAAPMIAYATSNTDEFLLRVNSVTDALDNTNPTISDRVDLIVRALAYPLARPHGLSIHAVTTNVNMIGDIASVFLGIGVVTWALSVCARFVGRPFPLLPSRPGIMLTVWFLLIIPISQTISMESHRFLSITPIWSLAIASGIVVIARGVFGLLRSNRLIVAAALIAGLAIGLQNLTYYFDESRQYDMWGDPSSTLAYDLGWRFHTAPADTRVLVLAWEDVQFTWAAATRYWAPEAVNHVTYVTDFSPTEPPFGPPLIGKGDVLIVGPAHLDDACAVASTNSRAIVGAGYDRYGNILYIAFTIDSAFPFRTGETPAESTFKPLTLTCP